MASLEKWVDELQASVDKLTKRVASAAAAAFQPVIETPTDGQILSYDATEEIWKNTDQPDAPTMTALVSEGTPIATYTAGESSVTLYAPGSNDDWSVLACNSSGFALNDDPIYTCPAGETLADYSAFMAICTHNGQNVASGRAFATYIDPAPFKKLAIEEVASATPFAAYNDFSQYCLFYVQRIGLKFNYTANTIKQDDWGSDTGSTGIRVVAVLGKKPIVPDTRTVKRRKTK